MKRKFIISETANYEVEAETIDKAMTRFIEGHITDFPVTVDEREIEAPEPNPVKVGDKVNVDAHTDHEEDFSGTVVVNEEAINGAISVKAPDGEVYVCDANYVYATEPFPLAGVYTNVQFNALPRWARDTILSLEASARELLKK